MLALFARRLLTLKVVGEVQLAARLVAGRDVYADRGYPSVEREASLRAAGWRVHVQRKSSATKPISDTQKRRNRRIATPRARIEHVFGALRHMGGKLVRCMGIVGTTFALHLKTASYNLQRLVYLKERGLQAF